MNLLRSCIGSLRDKFCDPREQHRKKFRSVSTAPIPVAMFPTIYENKMASGILKYEYEVIQEEVERSGFYEAAFFEKNVKKNQSQNIIPYKDNCVVLEPEPGVDSSTYINASWVDGQEKERKYIATQGPNMNTISDFWRMVWQYNSHCIVMVTSLFEHARQQCERYWPAFSCTFGAINVTSRDAISTAQYTIREFRVSKIDAPEIKRIIRQFQLDSWTKNGLPLIGAVIELTAKLYAWQKDREGPIIVHCSNGAGRTGTFICINELLDVIRNDEIGASIPLAQYALRVATARPQMIENFEQYSFIYTVLSEWVRSGGETSVPLKCLPIMVDQLERPSKSGYGIGHCASKYEAELTLINRLVKPLTVGECAGGHRIENRRKSRNVLIQPPERARPYLTTQDCGDANDYINAVFVDGYHARNQYIVTQWPLMSTINDFWCLAVDFQVSAIVLLNPFTLGDQKYPVFWPTMKTANQSTRFGSIGIELREVYEESDSAPGAFLLSIKKRGSSAFNPFMPNRNDNVSRDVILLNTRNWPQSSKIPGACDVVVRMAYMAREWNSMTDTTSPILVVSSEGVSRAGVFCAIGICMDRILAQSEVDVFRAVEIVKQNRPQLVTDLTWVKTKFHDIYRFVYMMAIKFISGSEIFASFFHKRKTEYKLCYNCALRISDLLAIQIKSNEEQRSRDPIEIFDELDRKRAEGELRRELIDTADQTSRRYSKVDSNISPPPVTTSSPPLQQNSSFSLSSSSITPSSCSSRTASLELPPKRNLPILNIGNKSRRLPTVTGMRDPPVSAPNRSVARVPTSIPILRSHRILPGGGNSARRKLPTIDSIIENPLLHDPRLNREKFGTKKALPAIANHYPTKKIGQGFIRCNGSRPNTFFGDNLIAPRPCLIRTETETSHLTSSIGEPHQRL